ncbi:MAG: hypothetical protein AABY15_00250 [Nanoarchaeota archaeon]
MNWEKLENARVIIGNKHMINKRLLDKETTIECFNETMNELLKENEGTYFKPENFDDIVDELFSMKNVHLAMTPCDDHFNKDGEYVGEFATHTRRGLGERDIIKSVKEYLEKGAVVYLYTFYNMKQGIVKGLENGDISKPIIEPDVNTYWWRMITKIDN